LSFIINDQDRPQKLALEAGIELMRSAMWQEGEERAIAIDERGRVLPIQRHTFFMHECAAFTLMFEHCYIGGGSVYPLTLS